MKATRNEWKKEQKGKQSIYLGLRCEVSSIYLFIPHTLQFKAKFYYLISQQSIQLSNINYLNIVKQKPGQNRLYLIDCKAIMSDKPK